jgi:hypothetical protein
MPFSDYQKALSMGLKEVSACHAKGISPYLPVLDEILEGVETCGEEELGLVSAPVELIVGTKSAGRQRAFTRSFLPILEPESELAAKWVSLCQSHLDQGIQDPITAYEYLHEFYVVEGHKRVSVLRYFGAVTIPAVVTRILPARDGTLKNQIYYEFLEFNRLSGINYLWFEQTGRFALLQSTVGKSAEEEWTAEDRRDFFSFYQRFKAAYQAKAGKEFPDLNMGNAMLATMDFYGYSQLKDCLVSELKERLAQIRETLEAAQGKPPTPAVAKLLRWLPPTLQWVKEPIQALFGSKESPAGQAKGI